MTTFTYFTKQLFQDGKMRLFLFVFLSFSAFSQTQSEKASFINSFDFKWTMRAMKKCGYEKLTPQDLAQDIVILKDTQKTDCIYNEAKRIKDLMDIEKIRDIQKKQAKESLDCSSLSGQIKEMCIILK